MQVVYTVPLRIPRPIAWTLRVCTMLLLIGAVVFTILGIVRVERNLPKPTHPMKYVHPILQPYK
jgi:hypothetical protein